MGGSLVPFAGGIRRPDPWLAVCEWRAVAAKEGVLDSIVIDDFAAGAGGDGLPDG